MGNFKLDILGISECRWNGSVIISTKNETDKSYTIIYSGQQDPYNCIENCSEHFSKTVENTLVKLY